MKKLILVVAFIVIGIEGGGYLVQKVIDQSHAEIAEFQQQVREARDAY